MREVLNIELSKQQQSSDWGSASLSEAQLAYAASDVLHLHALREKLDTMLAREGRTELARACFEFLPWRAKLDLSGWEAEDILPIRKQAGLPFTLVNVRRGHSPRFGTLLGRLAGCIIRPGRV